MHKESSTIRLLTVTTLMVAMLVSGCETTKNWLKDRRTAEARDPVVLGAPEMDSYLTELYTLVSGDPAARAEIYADAESAAKLTPGTSTRLRYALILATPGHTESDNPAALTILRDLLSQQELMTGAEIALATIYLKNVETGIVLDAEARSLRAENRRAATTEEAAVTRRITQVEAENRELRELLEDAEAKLQAITSIERSIRAQSENNETR